MHDVLRVGRRGHHSLTYTPQSPPAQALYADSLPLTGGHTSYSQHPQQAHTMPKRFRTHRFAVVPSRRGLVADVLQAVLVPGRGLRGPGVDVSADHLAVGSRPDCGAVDGETSGH